MTNDVSTKQFLRNFEQLIMASSPFYSKWLQLWKFNSVKISFCSFPGLAQRWCWKFL